MTNEKMEQKLASALEKTAPDDVSGVLSRCEVRKGTVIDMTTKKVRKKKWLPLVAACFAVMLLSGGGLFYQQIHAVASVVSLDVNPSFKLKVNRSEKVLACAPLNEEAKEILADMGYGADLKGAKLDVAVNAIVGSLVRNGYLDSISSAIMISVEDKDTARAEKLQRELTTTVDDVLQTSASRATVLTQTLTEDTEREQQAQKNHISTGKAALVNRVLAINPSLGFDELANLSVEELMDLAENGAPAMPIGKDKAMDIAVAEFGKNSTGTPVNCEVDPELDESPAYYDVEIQGQSGEEFEYKIDAYTGEVLDVKREMTDDDETEEEQSCQTAQTEETQDIGNAQAKTIALNHAGVDADAVYDMNTKMDVENGVAIYEVEFKSGNMEYEYEIDAVSGTILKHEAETDD